MATDKCPICGEKATSSTVINIFNGQRYIEWVYSCNHCGTFQLPNESLLRIVFDSDEKLYLLSCYLFENKQEHNDYQPIRLNRFELERISKFFPITVEEKIEKLLKYIERHSSFFGERVSLVPEIIYSKNVDELFNILAELSEKGYVDDGLSTDSDPSASIRIKGIEFIKEKKNKSDRNKCFVAMWFNPSKDKIYDDVIKPICEEVGYKTIRVDKLQFNDDITDHIIAEIKESYFVIADLTGFRGGVYYEAGFARGLGKEVILTCKKDYEIKIRYEKKGKLIPERGPHFDVSHLSTIFWKEDELDELKQNLKNRILATVGKGSYEPENIAR